MNELQKQILEAASPGQGAAIIKQLEIEEAVKVIDSLDELTAAFMMYVFRMMAYEHDEYACILVARADELCIRGTRGLIYARDKVYQETGYFAGI